MMMMMMMMFQKETALAGIVACLLVQADRARAIEPEDGRTLRLERVPGPRSRYTTSRRQI